MALRSSILPICIEDPTWVWSQKERRVYYAYRYAYIRHRCRNLIGLDNDYDCAVDIIKSCHCLSSYEFEGLISPKNVYVLTLTSFYENSELEDEIENANDKEFGDNTTPSLRLINEIVRVVTDEGGLTMDIVIDTDNEKVVIPFLTNKSAFLYSFSQNTMDIKDLADMVFTIKSRSFHVEKIYIIGLLDSSLQFYNI